MAKIFGTNGADNGLLGSSTDDEIYAYLLGGDPNSDFGNDYLRGFGGNDRLYGGGGDDLMVGDAGADIFTGGTGTDTVSYHTTTLALSLDLVTGGTGGDAQGDLFGSIENVIGTLGSDTILADNGANTLHGLEGNDNLNGRTGDDVLIGGAGADILTGGAGTDTASYYNSNAAVTVNLFSMTGTGGDAQGDIFGSVENVIGSNFADTLIGDNADNRLAGGAGEDFLDGGSRNDILEGGAGADSIFGGSGFDFADYSSSAGSFGYGVLVNLSSGIVSNNDAAGDTLFDIEGLIGSAFTDELIGNSGRNILIGNGGADTLAGRAGNDELRGDAGADQLQGGAGADDLYGGLDADTFQFFNASDSALGASDTIFDFQVGDTIHIGSNGGRQVSFSGFVDYDQYVAGTLGRGGDGKADLFHTTDGFHTYVIVDVDDDGFLSNGDMEIRLLDVQSVSSNDFSLLTL